MIDVMTCPRCGREDRYGRVIRGIVMCHQEFWRNPFVSVTIDCPVCGLVEQNYRISKYTISAELVVAKRCGYLAGLEIQELPEGVILVEGEKPA